MADRLHVVLAGTLVAVLSRDRAGSLSLDYTDTTGVVPLSPALPLGSRTHRGPDVSSFVEGLLPDDPAVRQRWAVGFGVPDTAFDLLAHAGRDCIGAVQFSSEADLDDVLAQAGRLVPVTDDEIGGRLHLLRSQQSGWTMPGERWSLPGAQPKFTLTRTSEGWCEPRGAAASTHIVKPGVTGMNHQAVVEFATMRVARRLGLPAAKVELAAFGGAEALVVQRYDRIPGPSGDTQRLHQVDMCQALGRLPFEKYEERGGPPARELARLIRHQSTSSDVDLRRFSDALIFNYLAGCPDGHAKNFAILYAGLERRLAPLYDTATGLPYDRLVADTTAAFRIGGVRRFGEAYPKHWIEHARELGLDPDERLDRVRGLCERIPEEFQAVLLDEIGGDIGERLWKRTSRGPGHLVRQCAAMARRLAPRRPRPTSGRPGRPVEESR